VHGNLQAGIGLNIVNNCVVTFNHFLDGSSTAGCFELTQLIKVERDELFNLEDIQAISDAGVRRESLRNSQAFLEGDDYRSKPRIQIFLAAPNDCFTW